MGCCSARCMLIFLCCLQLIMAVKGQGFDFLGNRWAPNLIHYLHNVVIVLGLLGAIHHRIGYVIMYLLGTLLWGGWNVFVCLLYLDLGGLLKGVSSHRRSWWQDNESGCQSEGLPSSAWENQPNPELTEVLNCWLEYQYTNILHCLAEILISLLGFVYACLAASTFSDEEESCTNVPGQQYSHTGESI